MAGQSIFLLTVFHHITLYLVANNWKTMPLAAHACLGVAFISLILLWEEIIAPFAIPDRSRYQTGGYLGASLSVVYVYFGCYDCNSGDFNASGARVICQGLPILNAGFILATLATVVVTALIEND